MADFSILTEDNNRFEKIEDILADIRVGMNKGNPDAKFVEILTVWTRSTTPWITPRRAT